MDFFDFIGVKLLDPHSEEEENEAAVVTAAEPEVAMCPTKILDVPRITFFGMDIYHVADLAKEERFGFHFKGRVVELTFNTMGQDGIMVFNTPPVFIDLANKLIELRKQLIRLQESNQALAESAAKYESIKAAEKVPENWGFRPVLRSTEPYSAWQNNPGCLYLLNGIWQSVSHVGMFALPLAKANHLVDGWYHFDTKFTI